MLRMESVSKVYKHKNKTVGALQEACLDISEGDFIAIIGPSGSGKSTLLLLLGGMLSPTSGEIFLDGQSLYDLHSDERARLRREKIGFLFQTFNLVPYLTAMENVQLPLFLTDVDEVGQEKKAATLLERVGLGDRLDHKPQELSVGQQQRVALARMMANEPSIILADEPTGNLDPETSLQIMRFLQEINEEGHTVLMVTHDMRGAQKARRTMKLVGGRFHA